MQHRDAIILKKIISEIDVASEMIDGCSLESFLSMGF